jgi:hypothetical protein
MTPFLTSKNRGRAHPVRPDNLFTGHSLREAFLTASKGTSSPMQTPFARIPLVGQGQSDIPPEPTPLCEHRSARRQGRPAGRSSERSADP